MIFQPMQAVPKGQILGIYAERLPICLHLLFLSVNGRFNAFLHLFHQTEFGHAPGAPVPHTLIAFQPLHLVMLLPCQAQGFIRLVFLNFSSANNAFRVHAAAADFLFHQYPTAVSIQKLSVIFAGGQLHGSLGFFIPHGSGNSGGHLLHPRCKAVEEDHHRLPSFFFLLPLQ